MGFVEASVNFPTIDRRFIPIRQCRDTRPRLSAMTVKFYIKRDLPQQVSFAFYD